MLDDGFDKNLESKEGSQNYSAMDITDSTNSVLGSIGKVRASKVSANKDGSNKASVSQDNASKRIRKIENSADTENVPEEKSSVVRDLASLVVRRTRQTIKHNWNAKLASLILAVLVWSIISANEQATRQLTVPVPITIIGQPILNEAYPLPKSIEVRLSGPNSRLEDLRIRDLTATLDLRNVSGDFQERVRVTRPRGIDIESYTPEIIIGKVD